MTTLLRATCKSDENATVSGDGEYYQCGYLFAGWGLSDTWIGLILLVVSLSLLWTCLVVLVKLLKSLMQDKIAVMLRDNLNADFPLVPWLTGYVAILVGALITIFIQSSSVFTSTLTPLCGAGFFTLERAYPLTLGNYTKMIFFHNRFPFINWLKKGSNMGTTTTGLLAALATDPDQLHDTLQIALVHLFFNISAILVFYPIPFMRWPVPMAHAVGAKVTRYPWTAVVYVVIIFFLMPTCVFGLALISPIAVYVGFLPLFAVLVVAVIINAIQV